MKLLVFLFFCLDFYSIQAQQNTLNGNVASMTTYTIHGMPAGSKLENIKSGSVFFKDEWMNSTVVLKDGRQFKDVKAKLNLYENNVHFLRNSTELVADSPISDLILSDSANATVYHFVRYNNVDKPAASGEERWYLSLLEGPVSVYKLFEKAIEESRTYNSATVDRSIETKQTYFVLYKGELRRVNKIRELPEILYDNRPELTAFIKRQSKKAFENQLIEAVAYYNSLKQ